jgi:hypothetical protein
VTKEAAVRSAGSLVGGSNVWPCQKRTLQTQNWAARVTTTRSWGRVYSPNLSKKKKFITIKFATARSLGAAVGSKQAADANLIASMGSATWGRGTGSLALYNLSRWVKGRAKSEPRPYLAMRHGSGYPSSTKACVM